eukprot:jgi/Tetstr1/420389/TSEL_011505.t1
MSAPAGLRGIWAAARWMATGVQPALQASRLSGLPRLPHPSPPLTSTGQRAACASGPPSTPGWPDAIGTADLCDEHVLEPVDVITPRGVAIAHPIFRDFGGKLRFGGMASTVLCYENNPLVRKALGEPGEGRVLVVDGGASMRCALLGDQLAEMGARNGWSGIIVHGCIRDSETIGTLPLGVKALATFAGVTVRPGDYVYADKDGILVSPHPLTA